MPAPLGTCAWQWMALTGSVLWRLQYEDVNPDQDGETQPASQFQTRSSKLAEKIKRAEQVTRDTAAAHRQALERNTVRFRTCPAPSLRD